MKEILRLNSNSESLIIYKKNNHLYLEFDVTKSKKLDNNDVELLLNTLKENVQPSKLNKILNSTEVVEDLINEGNKIYFTTDKFMNNIIHLEDNNNSEYMKLNTLLICEIYKKLINLVFDDVV